jgi:excinuclease ABC subunit A
VGRERSGVKSKRGSPPQQAIAATEAPRWLRVRGARVHNLREVNLDVPHHQLTVITGVSGSGKSSLAIDTIFAEGQRQYIDTLSTYARQFFDQLPRPDVDWIEGLEPTLCIDQRSGVHHVRSTVATITEVYDYLRLLFARCGQPVCHRCGTEVSQQTPEAIEQALDRLPEGTKLMLMAPLVRGRKGTHQAELARVRKAGLVRVRVNGEVEELETLPELSARKTHSIDAVVDRIVTRAGQQSRISESVRLALRLGEGAVVAAFAIPDSTQWDEKLFSTRLACHQCGISFEELEPRTFSFNSPYGACQSCDGLGTTESFDLELVIADRSRSIRDGGLAPWRSATAAAKGKLLALLSASIEDDSIDLDAPIATIGAAQRKKLDAALLTILEQEVQAAKPTRREQLAAFRGMQPCNQCGGGRLRPEALAVRLAGRSIDKLCGLAIDEALETFASIQIAPPADEIAAPLLREIVKRLAFLKKVGVGYLTLDRPADSLSGGELQRVRLATSIGSGLVGVCYVLDEPSVGLHPRDNDRLIESLRDLQAVGNTVLVVEHDEAMIRAADRLVDIGPGAGRHGGQVVAVGTPEEVAASADSLTGQYLAGTRQIPIPAARRKANLAHCIALKEATLHNLKRVSVNIPLGCLVGVSGVSGSGKSSLITRTLAPALIRALGNPAPRPGPFKSLDHGSRITKLVPVDQSPIGRSPRSCPATFTGVFDEIRKVFAETRDAKQRGFAANRFSFNAGDGRCSQCDGQGLERIEMNFLSDLFITCTACNGTRFNAQTLDVRYKQATIADVLSMTVEQSAEFFENFAKIKKVLDSLHRVGLGYLQLGQASTTLSGGEAQRLKLATELSTASPQSASETLYLLDEPTTGLHLEDVRRLLEVLHALVDRGSTVIVIEHHVDVLRSCDWLIDLGPEGGHAGGELLYEGTPEGLMDCKRSLTAPHLRLDRH